MPMGGPSVGGGLTGEVMQVLPLFVNRTGNVGLTASCPMEYVAPARKWLIYSTSFQTYQRGFWFMTDDPLTGQWEDIPNVPHNDPATDWLTLVGVFRDRLVFCNRTGATYRWYQCTLDFSVWQEIGSMVPFSSAPLGTDSGLNGRWGFFKDTDLLGDVFIVQGNNASASERLWYTSDNGANWSSYDYLVSGFWGLQTSFGNLPDSDGLPGNDFCVLGTRNQIVRIGHPFFDPFPGPGVSFLREQVTAVSSNIKSQFLARPDGRILLNAVADLWFSTDNALTWNSIPSGTLLGGGFGITNSPVIIAYDEKTDAFLLRQKFITWRTEDFVTWEVLPGVASHLEHSVEGTGRAHGGQLGELILNWPEGESGPILRSIARL